VLVAVPPLEIQRTLGLRQGDAAHRVGINPRGARGAVSQPLQRFRRVRGAPFFLKSGPTLAIRRDEAIFVTEVQVIAPPRVMVRTLPGQDVPLCLPHLVAAGQLRGDGAQGGISGVARLAMKVLLLKNAIRIKYLLPTTAYFRR
jgi:hypothetical protein